ncbi:hypothetical protein EVAR_19156_1 [Eumeta japonica]|uniref:Integrin beta subunit cytoplasmic domain-containing protein n=1 Tax=Eumeta variegata TaxID=151549 RepID=A0A4C1VLP5_EUMVA|nr:hypothetical protein EVAR_19156_1 [Eumeta japonica]
MRIPVYLQPDILRSQRGDRSRACSELASATIMRSSLIIIALVVAIGIIFIIGVKIAQHYADKRAYAKFLAEAQQSMALNDKQENPLYISPISEFRLPESFPRDKQE